MQDRICVPSASSADHVFRRQSGRPRLLPTGVSPAVGPGNSRVEPENADVCREVADTWADPVGCCLDAEGSQAKQMNERKQIAAKLIDDRGNELLAVKELV